MDDIIILESIDKWRPKKSKQTIGEITRKISAPKKDKSQILIDSIEGIPLYEIHGYFVDDMRKLTAECHNVNGPAVIGYYPCGAVRSVEYWYYGRRHRDDGAAIETFSADGELTGEMFFICGEKVPRDYYYGRLDPAICDIIVRLLPQPIAEEIIESAPP